MRRRADTVSSTTVPRSRIIHGTEGTHRGGERDRRQQPRLAPRLQGLGGPRPRPQAASRHPGGASDRGRPARARVVAGRPVRDRPHPRLHHDVAASGHRGRELRRERRHGAEPPGRPRFVRRPPARRPRHRPEALSRAVRGLREDQAGDAVPRGDAAAALRELLLRAGGRGLRGGQAAGLRLERAPPPHDHRLRPRQRHEHGRHPRRVRHDLPGDRPALRLPRLRSSSGRG